VQALVHLGRDLIPKPVDRPIEQVLVKAGDVEVIVRCLGTGRQRL
jgi:hypothetical protein